jgi:hypothetical protein
VRKWKLNFAYEVSRSYSQRYLICRKILLHGTEGFTFPPQEFVLWIFIALKTHSSSAGFEPANPGFNR